MALYTFYCQRADGRPLSIESADLACDQTAATWADRVLIQHRSCGYVDVVEDQRLVLTARRMQPARASAHS